MNKNYCLKALTVLIITLSATLSGWAQSIPASEKQALVDLYNSTKGTSWGGTVAPSKSWDLNADVSTWRGVTIKDGHVDQLKLDGFFLDGPIPASIGNLTELTWLDLSSNRITGPLPQEMFLMKKLQVLRLESQVLPQTASEGKRTLLTELPAKIDLPELTMFLLNNNGLQGALPSDVNMPKVQWVLLHDCRFTGSIPQAWFNLPKVQYLYLHNNQFDGKVSEVWGNMPELKDLFLNGNKQLEGSIPASIAQCKNLLQLNLQNTRMGGTLPEEIGELSALKALVLSNANFSGTLPKSLENLTNLTLLGLGNNHFSGKLPNLSKLTELATLELSVNDFEDTFPAWLGDLRKLRQVYMAKCGLSGQLLPELAPVSPDDGEDDGKGIKSLLELDLSLNNLSGEIPARWSGLRDLTVLILEGNQLTGEPFKVLLKLDKISNLLLSDNNFSGTITGTFDGRMPHIAQINLANNHFSGAILSTYQTIPFSGIFGVDEEDFGKRSNLNLSGNNFLFIDFENIGDNLSQPDIVQKGFLFYPQRPFGQESEHVLKEGQTLTLDATLAQPKNLSALEDGVIFKNTYNWYLNDKPIAGAVKPTLEISGAQATAGVYHCKVTNDIAPKLVLQSAPVTVKYEASVAQPAPQGFFYQDGSLLVCPSAQQLVVFDLNGVPVAAASASQVELSALPQGHYLAVAWVNGDKWVHKFNYNAR